MVVLCSECSRAPGERRQRKWKISAGRVSGLILPSFYPNLFQSNLFGRQRAQTDSIVGSDEALCPLDPVSFWKSLEPLPCIPFLSLFPFFRDKLTRLFRITNKTSCAATPTTTLWSEYQLCLLFTLRSHFCPIPPTFKLKKHLMEQHLTYFQFFISSSFHSHFTWNPTSMATIFIV